MMKLTKNQKASVLSYSIDIYINFLNVLIYPFIIKIYFFNFNFFFFWVLWHRKYEIPPKKKRVGYINSSIQDIF
jgi:hypothetical protein